MRTLKILFIIILTGITGLAYSQNCSVNAGVDQIVCSSNTLTLTGDYSGSFPVTKVTVWTQVSGPSAIITNPSALVTTVTGLVGRNSYRFRLSSTCLDGSLTYDEVTVTVNNITVANAGVDFSAKAPGTYSLSANSPGSGEAGAWTVVSGSVGSGPTPATSPTASFTLNTTTAGNVTLRWTISNATTGCTTFDDVIIPKMGGVSPVTAGNDITLTGCFTGTATSSLSASFGGNGTGGQGGLWSVVSGPNMPTISSPTTNTTNISNLITGTYVFRWTVSGPVVNGYDEVQVTVPTLTGAATTATAQVYGSPTMPFCDGRTEVVLVGSTPKVNETGTWSQTVGPAATIVSPGNPTTSITGLNGTANYTFKYTITSGSCSTSATTSISYGGAPSLNITSASPLNLTCDVSTATILYTQSTSGQTTYSILSGPTTPTITTIPSAYSNINSTTASTSFNITGLTVPGTYLVRVRKISGTCGTIYDDITIVVSKSPSASNAGSDQILACNVTSAELVGNTPTVGTGRWSQVSGPNTAVIANPALSRCPVTGLTNGNYVFRWIVSAGSTCSTNQDEVTVKIASSVPTTANAGADQTICNSTPLFLAGNNPLSNETGTWSVSPTSGVVFANVNSPTSMVTGLASSTVYTFTWRIANSCGTSSDNVIVTTSATVGPIAALAGSDQCLVAGTTTATMAANNPSPGTAIWTQLTGGPATISSPTSNTTTITGLSNGTYTFEWAITRNECTTTRDTVMVNISAAATTANAGTDQNVCGNSAIMAANTPVVGTGTWTQVTGLGGAVISNVNDPTATISNLTDGVYTFRWTIANNGCSSSVDDVKLYVSTPSTPANAGLDQVLCGVTLTTMSANSILIGSGYWNLVSGPNTPIITTNSSPVTTVTGLTTGTYVFSWNSSAGPFCPVSSDEMTIVIVPTAAAGTDQNLCNASSTALLGNVNTFNGVWTQVGTSPSIATITSLPTSPWAATASGLISGGPYTFRYTIPAANCTSSDDVLVTTSAMPALVDAGADMELCNVTSWSMNAGAMDAGATGQWARISGPNTPTIASTSSRITTIGVGATAAIAGTYIYEWRVTNGSCVVADQVMIKISKVTARSAGIDQSICGTTATMAAQAATSGTGTWSLVSGPNAPTISSVVSPTTTITGLITGTYVFAWTITDGSCTPAVDEVSITVATAPTTPNAGSDRELCNATTVTLAGNAITTGTGTWSKISGPTCTITNVNNPTSTVTGLTPGTYVFQWTASNGSCADLTDQVSIINYNAPTTSNAGSDFNACLYAPLNLSANTPVYGTGAWTQISGPAVVGFTNASLPTTAITGALAGTYTFRWTISNGTCSNSTDDVVVTIDQPATIADAGPNQTISANYATMAANTIAIGTGMWTKISGPAGSSITNPTSPTTTVTNLVAGTYVFSWTATNISCSSSDEVTIVYNGISCVISNKMIQHKLQ